MKRLFSHRRVTYSLCLAGISAIGIASRVFHTGHPVFDKYLGDAIYGVVFYLFLSIVCDRATPRRKAALTFAFVMVVELFQLTLMPWRFSLSDSLLLRIAAILLGTRFAWPDIGAYLVGIAGVFLVDKLWIRREGASVRIDRRPTAP